MTRSIVFCRNEVFSPLFPKAVAIFLLLIFFIYRNHETLILLGCAESLQRRIIYAEIILSFATSMRNKPQTTCEIILKLDQLRNRLLFLKLQAYGKFCLWSFCLLSSLFVQAIYVVDNISRTYCASRNKRQSSTHR